MLDLDAVVRQTGVGSSFNLLLIYIFVLTALYWFFLRGGGRWSKPPLRSAVGGRGIQLPPSPPGLPLIGNLHQLGSHPHRSLRDLADSYGPVMLLQLGRIPTLVVSSAEAAREVMKTHDLAFASRPPFTAARLYSYGYKDMAVAPYGDYWRQVRKICAVHLLGSKQVDSFRTVREEEVVTMIKEIYTSSGSSVNLSEKIVSMTNSILSRVAVGKRFSEKDDAGKGFRKLLAECGECGGGFKVGDFFPPLAWVDKMSGFDAKMEKNFWQLDGFLERLIQERLAGGDGKSGERNSFLDILLSLLMVTNAAGFSLDRDGVKALIMDMFVGGTDSTFTAIDWAMAELIRHPGIMKKVQDEVRGIAVGEAGLVREDDLESLGYLKSVVKETLRLHPPGPLLLPRESLSRVQLQGLEIPAGTRVLLNAWAIGRDPISWKRADEFWPERFMVDDDASGMDFRGLDFRFIPFGAGRRGCPGVSFAVPVVELSLANLLYHFNWRVPGESRAEDLDMSETFGVTAHRKSSLTLVRARRVDWHQNESRLRSHPHK